MSKVCGLCKTLYPWDKRFFILKVCVFSCANKSNQKNSQVNLNNIKNTLVKKIFSNYVMCFSLVWLRRTLCVLCGANTLVRFCIIQYCSELVLICVNENWRLLTYITMFALQCNWNIVIKYKTKQSSTAPKLCP